MVYAGNACGGVPGHSAVVLVLFFFFFSGHSAVNYDLDDDEPVGDISTPAPLCSLVFASHSIWDAYVAEAF